MDLDPREDPLLRTRRRGKHYAADGRKLADQEYVGARTPDTDADSPVANPTVTPPR
ncbi:MAG: hypothetical protein KF773_19175 [Deltaproteobacteria bacterium]|nr:hypothetical protein [Deltaproteobacteria bacterium]MCW5804926.1 hypothetical protein [Deltaproteobacteria bacterium]